MCTKPLFASMNESELAEYARKKGLYVEQIKSWKDACMNANGGVAKEAAKLNRDLKNSQIEVKNLKGFRCRKHDGWRCYIRHTFKSAGIIRPVEHQKLLLAMDHKFLWKEKYIPVVCPLSIGQRTHIVKSILISATCQFFQIKFVKNRDRIIGAGASACDDAEAL